MSMNSTGNARTTVAFAALIATSTGVGSLNKSAGEDSISSVYESMGRLSTSTLFAYRCSINEIYSLSQQNETHVPISSIKMRIRYQSIEESFINNCNIISDKKALYFNSIANSVCKLPIVDNAVSYNEFDDSLDFSLKLTEGLTMRISQFLDEDIDSPVVFSIHRNETLLVSDELPVDEIVQTILSAMNHNGKRTGYNC